MWFVVVFQALIVFLLIYRLAGYFQMNWPRTLSAFVLVLFLTLLTGISNYVSQIMPDIFTAVLILSFAMLFIETNSKWRWLLWFFVLVSSMMHFSNVLLITALGFLSFLFLLVFRKKAGICSKLLLHFASLTVLPWLLIPSVNYIYSGEFYLSKSGHVFLTGRLIETGCLPGIL
jgi:hypothetical protein